MNESKNGRTVLAALMGMVLPAPSERAARKMRVRAIAERTGWAFARCRELVDTMTDVEIEALVRREQGR